MNYKVLTLLDRDEWNYYLSLLPDIQQDIYFSPEYYSFYENNNDGLARCFVFKKGNEIALYPFLINSVNSLGFDLDNHYYDIQGAYGYNGVASSTYSDEFIKDFYKEYNHFCKDNDIIAEFVRFHPLLNNIDFSKVYYKTYFDRKTVYVDTASSPDEVFKTFQTTTRKQIKRCINRYKIEVEIKNNDKEHLDTFLKIYWETMKRVNSGKYLYFNEEFFYALFSNPNTIQFIAKYNNKPIAIITALAGKRFLHGHLGGALTEYLNFSAYSLLYWAMIKYANENGKTMLHVGGGTTKSTEDSLFNFKRNFSSLTSDFYIGKKIHNNNVYEKVRFQWKDKYPASFEKNKNLILGYREIPEEKL